MSPSGADCSVTAFFDHVLSVVKKGRDPVVHFSELTTTHFWIVRCGNAKYSRKELVVAGICRNEDVDIMVKYEVRFWVT